MHVCSLYVFYSIYGQVNNSPQISIKQWCDTHQWFCKKNFSNVNEPGDTFCSCIMCMAKWKNYTFQILQIQKFASNLGQYATNWKVPLGWFQIAQLWNFNRNFPILLTLLLQTTANICSACILYYKCFTIVSYHHNDSAIRFYDCNYTASTTKLWSWQIQP
jgi:hypothetical protein